MFLERERSSSELEASVWERWGLNAFAKHPLPVCWFWGWSHTDGLLSPIRILGCRHRSLPGKPPLMLCGRGWEGRGDRVETQPSRDFTTNNSVWAKLSTQVHKVQSHEQHLCIRSTTTSCISLYQSYTLLDTCSIFVITHGLCNKQWNVSAANIKVGLHGQTGNFSFGACMMWKKVN